MEYNTYKLSEFSSFKYGKMPKNTLKVEKGYPIYTGYKISGYYKEYMYEEEQLIVVARGVGGTGDVKLSPPFSYITNLSIIIELNENVLDKFYMKLYLNSLRLRYLDSGSAQSQITISDLKNLEIQVPSIKEQKNIVKIIKTIEIK